jgi:hypothetical protein
MGLHDEEEEEEEDIHLFVLLIIFLQWNLKTVSLFVKDRSHLFSLVK